MAFNNTQLAIDNSIRAKVQSACEAGDLDTIKELIRVHSFYYINNKCRVLYLSAAVGDLKAIKYLLTLEQGRAGHSGRHTDNVLETLTAAIRNLQWEVVDYCLSFKEVIYYLTNSKKEAIAKDILGVLIRQHRLKFVTHLRLLDKLGSPHVLDSSILSDNFNFI